jgi:hypothetical protein
MHHRRVGGFIAALVLSVPPLGAQARRWQPLVAIGSDSDEHARLAQLRGLAGTTGYLLRSASSMATRLSRDTTRLRWALLLPEYTAVYNSALPFSLNDGAMWAGRGWNHETRAGIRAAWKRVSLTLAPEFLVSENLAYGLPPPLRRLPLPPGRDSLSSPWHTGPSSIDLPLRFGVSGFVRADPGQSSLSIDWGAVTTGLATENEWWGPGIRNAIVLSNNAAGIPRLFVRTSRPIETRVGRFEARWFLGGLFKSPYFDRSPADDRRSITALAATWTPSGMPTLTLGFTRAVYAPLVGWQDVFGHVFDVVKDRGWHRASGDSTIVPSRDQLFSVFGRWVFPADGLAVHFEWARHEPPTSLRDFLTAPNHSQGYTLGLEWATSVHGDRDALRVQAEMTNLEQSATFRDRPVDTWYTGRAAPQGYTQRGQVIGAAIGPGASSQWLAIDYFGSAWSVGLFGGRIRWDDDALYALPSIQGNTWCSHDVSLFAGVKTAYASRWGHLEAIVTPGERLNVFYHYLTWCGSGHLFDILDARNTTLQVRFSPRLP